MLKMSRSIQTNLVRGLTLILVSGTLVSGCYTHPAAPPAGYENNDMSCSDGFDNDQDGWIDCKDPDCIVFSNFCGEVVPEFPEFAERIRSNSATTLSTTMTMEITTAATVNAWRFKRIAAA